jgi:uncharacterized YigZ family protein
MPDHYKTISAPSSGIFKDKGSSFLAFAFPVDSELQVKECIKKVKSLHPKCNHHCYAFRLAAEGNIARSSDDREPSGSAGRPILNAIQSFGLTDCLVVVARYFGGSLLGVPGLIHAYRSAAEDALNNSSIVTIKIMIPVRISFPYELLNDIMVFLKEHECRILHQEFGEEIQLDAEVPSEVPDLVLGKMNNDDQGYLIRFEKL